MKRIAFSLLLGLALVPVKGWSGTCTDAVQSRGECPPTIRGIRPLGMGDAFTAVSDDQNVFFYNPAGSVQRTGSLVTILEVPVTLGKDFQDAYDFIKDNEDDLTNFDGRSASRQAELIDKIDAEIAALNPSFGVGFPNSSYVSGPVFDNFRWGTGLFGHVGGRFRVNSGIAPSIDYDINSDVILPVNVSHRFEDVWRLPGRLGVGMNLKLIQRRQIRQDRVSFFQLEEFDAPPMQNGSAFGADLGVLHQFNDRWSFGLSALDIFGTSFDFDSADAEDGFTAKPSRTGSTRARWNLGAAWTPTQITYWPTKDGVRTRGRLLLVADIKDILNSDDKVFFDDGLLADTAWSHLHLGAEYRWWFLRGRLGANQGYPTFGFGVDIPFLKFDYTFYSDELGLRAGTQKQSNHMLSLALRLGTGNTEARERIKNSREGGSKKAEPQAKPLDAAPETAAPAPAADVAPADAAPAMVPVDSPAATAAPAEAGEPAAPAAQ
ncbi:MAG: conjugal transfer protein TraF [Elusimicrobiota bacterium]